MLKHNLSCLCLALVGYWSGYWDELEEGNFTNMNNGTPMGDNQDWFYGEPNGGLVENCVNIWPNRDGLWNDDDCSRLAYSAFCEFSEAPYLQIRGKGEEECLLTFLVLPFFRSLLYHQI